MEKRGIIEIHFNWIFILIAGVIILLFFINIVNRQKGFSDVKTSGTIITSLDSLLIGAEISSDTLNVLDMPNVEIGFECNRYFIGSVPKQTRGNAIFAPGILKGREMITWTQDWSMPYRITNFLYITDPELRYVIVNNSGNLGQKIYEELPDELNKEVVDETELGNFVDKNNYKIRFVFLGNTNMNSVLARIKIPDEDVTAINVTDIGGSSLIPLTGTIQFLRKKGLSWEPQGETYYVKSLFGALFSEDLDMYNCVMRKAFRKLNLVSKIYLRRSNELATYYGIGDTCYSPHIRARDPINNIISSSEQESNSFPNGLDEMNNLISYGNNIKDENQRTQLGTCALIY